MSDFDFEIKADASQAIAAEQRVVQGLTEIEIRAVVTGREITNAFGKSVLKDAEGKFSAMAVAARQAAGGVSELAEAQKKLPADAGGHGGAGGGHGDIGHLAGAFGIGASLHELVELANTYTEVSNKLRVVSESQGEFNHLMDETQSIAIATRTSWDQTASTFQRLSAVTHDLGMSQNSVLRLTREMAIGAKVSGASQQEAAMAMNEFTHAFELGTLQGREFKVLMRDVPQEMTELRHALGLSAEKFAEMGKHGKLTAEMIVEGFDKASGALEAKFSKTTPTLSEQWSVFKDKMTSVVGEVNSALGLFQRLGETFDTVAKNARLLGDAIGTIKGGLDFVTSKLSGGNGTGDQVIGAAKTYIGWITNPLTAVRDVVDEISSHVGDKLGGAFRRVAAGFSESLQNAVEVSGRRIDDVFRVQAELAKSGRLGSSELSIGVSADEARKIDETRVKLKELGIVVEDRFSAAKTAAKQLLDEVTKLEEKRAMKQLNEDALAYERTLNNINDLLDKQRKSYSTAEERKRELEQAIHFAEALQKQQAAVKSGSPTAGGLSLYTSADVATATTALRNLTDNQKELAKVNEELRLKTAGHSDAIIKIKLATIDQVQAEAELLAELRAGTLTWDEYEKAVKKAHGALTEAEKIMQRLLKPFHDFSLGEAALNQLINSGRINVEQYNAEMKKLIETAEHSGERINFFVGPKTTSGGLRIAESTEKFAPAKEHESIVDKLGIQLPKLGVLTEDYTEKLDRQRAAMAQIVDPVRNYHDEQDALDALLRQSSITLVQYNILSQKAAQAYRAQSEALSVLNPATVKFRKELQEIGEKQDPLHGLKDGLNAIYDEITNVSDVVKTTLTDAFHGLEGQLVEVFTGGKTSWSDFANTMEKDLIKLALRILEMKLLTAIFAPGGGGGGFASSGAVGAFGSIFGAFFGGAHADGGDYVVPGSGGPDSRAVMFQLTPGERVSFTPPGGSSSSRTEVHFHHDPRALLDVVQTREGARTLHATIRKNPGVLGTLTGR